VTGVHINRLVATAVIHYDSAATSEGEVLQRLETADLFGAEPISAADTTYAKIGRWFERLIDKTEASTPPVVQVVVSASALAASLFMAPLQGPLALLASVPIICRALKTAMGERRISVDGLDGMATMMMIANHNFGPASFMMSLIALGEYIRELTAQRCQKIIDDLLGLAGRSAWLVKGNRRLCIPAEQVRVNDVVVVYPGEMIPIDGVVVKGEALVNQASLTGESAPVEAILHKEVFAATVVVEGQVYLRCTAASHESRARQVMDLVKAAPLHETKIQNYAAMMADKAVLPILLSAVACFALTRNLVRTMSMLIYDFSTGIRIAAPTAVLASMARAGRHGILVKSGGALERLAKVNAIVFDKTGTLTSGHPKINAVHALNGFQPDELLGLAAAVEVRLSHPAAQAIVAHATAKGIDIPSRTEASHAMGMGVGAQVNGRMVLVGSQRMMSDNSVPLSEAAAIESDAKAAGLSLAYVAVDNKLAGVVSYSDTLRDETPKMITRLHKRGVKKIIMATGDNEAAARRIASRSGVDQILSGAFPEQKAQLVKDLMAQGYTVAVVGDGINDSPALAHADVAISLRGGTDAAREHADVVLTDDDLLRLPEAIDIARGSMALVGETMALVAVPNGAGLALSSIGLIGPAGATLLNNGSAIVAAVNSLRPLMLSSWTRLREEQIADQSRLTREPKPAPDNAVTEQR
jgi:Cu2+-exporting ATPase